MTSDIETLLPDLTGASLRDLTKLRPRLAGDRERLMEQIQKPRINIGTGPPGRAD